MNSRTTGWINRFKKPILNINMVYERARHMCSFSYNLSIIRRGCRYPVIPFYNINTKNNLMILICSILCKKEVI